MPESSVQPDNTVEDSSRSLLDDLDRVIHEPARLLILSNLYVVESADFVFIQNQTGLTRGNLSSHMSKLEAAGYIVVEKKFVKKLPKTLLSLTEEGQIAFKRYVDQMKHLLNAIQID